MIGGRFEHSTLRVVPIVCTRRHRPANVRVLPLKLERSAMRCCLERCGAAGASGGWCVLRRAGRGAVGYAGGDRLLPCGRDPAVCARADPACEQRRLRVNTVTSPSLRIAGVGFFVAVCQAGEWARRRMSLLAARRLADTRCSVGAVTFCVPTGVYCSPRKVRRSLAMGGLGWMRSDGPVCHCGWRWLRAMW